ncbi:MAG: hypothetical protein AB7I59_28035 [Geminicoccaceae bacterium]
MGDGSERAMRAARKRRLAAAGLLALSMFSCSYGDREDQKEDEKNQRSGPAAMSVVAPATAVLSLGSRPGLAGAVGQVQGDVQA